MATAKPSRSKKPVSSKPPTPAENRRQKQKNAEERTRRMADAAYQKAYRRAQVAIARQQAKQQAMKDAGVDLTALQPQPQQAQPQQQPPEAKPQSSKTPPKSGKPATRSQGKRKPAAKGSTNAKRIGK